MRKAAIKLRIFEITQTKNIPMICYRSSATWKLTFANIHGKKSCDFVISNTEHQTGLLTKVKLIKLFTEVGAENI